MFVAFVRAGSGGAGAGQAIIASRRGLLASAVMTFARRGARHRDQGDADQHGDAWITGPRTFATLASKHRNGTGFVVRSG